jgi:hypothetical protein
MQVLVQVQTLDRYEHPFTGSAEGTSIIFCNSMHCQITTGRPLEKTRGLQMSVLQVIIRQVVSRKFPAARNQDQAKNKAGLGSFPKPAYVR